MHTQVLDDSRPVVMVMKRLGLGGVCSGVEFDVEAEWVLTVCLQLCEPL